MGILDDAIRQHLELKRQHGASEEELQRQEEEALGPARRDVVPAEAPAGDGEPSADAETGEPVATEPEAGEAAPPEMHDGETVLLEPEGEAPVPEPAADAPVEPPSPDPGPYDAAADVEALDEEEALEPQDAEEEEPAASDFESLDDDALPGDEAPPSGESDADVLEDTPDFLQETPEHDRLWFEQKPPRDFDFD
jgi:hypothetical protein